MGRLPPALFFSVHSFSFMTDYKRFGNENSMAISGRISFIKEVTNPKNGSSFLNITLISTLSTDGQEVSVVFNHPVTQFYKNGYMMPGRICRVVGHIDSAKETYVDKDGELGQLSRTEIKFADYKCFIDDNGWGPIPGTKKDNKVNRPIKGRVPSSPAEAAPYANTPATGYVEVTADPTPVLSSTGAELDSSFEVDF